MKPCAASIVRWTADAIDAIQTAAEDFTANVLEDANYAAVHGKRVTVQPKDILLARRIRGDLPGDKQTILGDKVTYWPAREEVAGEGEYDSAKQRIPGTGWIPPKARLGSEAARRAKYDAERRHELRGAQQTEAERVQAAQQTQEQAERVRVLQEQLVEKRARKQALRDAQRQEELLEEERVQELAGQDRQPVREGEQEGQEAQEVEGETPAQQEGQ